MDGCSGFTPDHHTVPIKQYSVGLRAVTAGAIVQGAHADGHSKKAAATRTRAAAAVFPQQKTTGSVLADPCVFTSFEQFS